MEKAKELVIECKKQGLDIKITETFRTKQEQDDLYAQGRTKSGKKVTNVRYPWSNHNWGVAFDICINSKTDAYNVAKLEKAGAIGRKLGLYWGGDWPSFKDRPHFESKKPEHITENLIKKYSNPEQFKKTWKKEEARKVEKIKVLINGVATEVEAITENNVNYIKLRDIQTKNMNLS